MHSINVGMWISLSVKFATSLLPPLTGEQEVFIAIFKTFGNNYVIFTQLITKKFLALKLKALYTLFISQITFPLVGPKLKVGSVYKLIRWFELSKSFYIKIDDN